MTATAIARQRVHRIEQTIEAQALTMELDRLDGAMDARRERTAALLGEAQQQLATLARLDGLNDGTRQRLAATLRELAGHLDREEPIAAGATA